jgi:GntR family transcriptional regulator
VLDIDPKRNTPIYQQVVHQVKEAILKGVLAPGERLPSVRELATTLIINPNTIQKAYQELERQGVIITVRGRGSFVDENLGESEVPDPRHLCSLRRHFERGIVDAHYLGLSASDIRDLVDELLEKVLRTGRDEHC